MGKVNVSYELDTVIERDELRLLLDGARYRDALWDVDQDIRSKLKHGSDKWLEDDEAADYLEHIRSMISETGLHDGF